MSKRRLRIIVSGLVIGIFVIAALAFVLVKPLSAPQLQSITPTFGAISSANNPLVENRQIEFMSNRTGNWEIYQMALSDHSVTNLSNDASDDGYGSYSSDGGAITFLSNRSYFALTPFMMAADGSAQHGIVNDLRTILSVLASGRLNWGLTYGGDRSVFVSLRDLNLEVYSKDANGEHNLSQNGAIDWFPAISPDGSQIAFGSDRDGNQEIYVMNSDGSNTHRLTNAPGDDLYPMWSGSSTVVFMSDRDIQFSKGQIGLYSLDISDPNAQPQRLSVQAPMMEMGWQISPLDGSRLYMANSDGHWNLYQSDSVGRNAQLLTENSGDNLFPIWRPQPG